MEEKAGRALMLLAVVGALALPLAPGPLQADAGEINRRTSERE